MTDRGNIYTGICIVATDKNGAIPPCGRCRELMKQINYDNLKTKIKYRHTDGTKAPIQCHLMVRMEESTELIKKGCI